MQYGDQNFQYDTKWNKMISRTLNVVWWSQLSNVTPNEMISIRTYIEKHIESTYEIDQCQINND